MRLKDFIYTAHKKNKKQNWIGESIWNQLCDKWETSQFKNISEQKKKTDVLTLITLAHFFTLEVLFQWLSTRGDW